MQKPQNQTRLLDVRIFPDHVFLIWAMSVFFVFFAANVLGLPARADSLNESDPQDYIQTIFTPYEDGLAAYTKFLDRSRKSIYMAGYSFGDKSIVDKLVELKTTRNVEVHILLDFSQTQGRSASAEAPMIDSLRRAGIEVIAGSSEKSHQLMHDKYTVVDDLWVESGSWNYTRAANKQDNVLDIIKSPKRAKLFRANWDRMYPVMKAQQMQRDETAFLKTASFVLAGMFILLFLIAAAFAIWRTRSSKASPRK
jgi:phosphatidylserine/phosphatidylglycerophosphate/cardiolipin synthase-like enzyme